MNIALYIIPIESISYMVFSFCPGDTLVLRLSVKSKLDYRTVKFMFLRV